MSSLLAELKKYPALAYVGILLSLQHILTFILWSTEKPLSWILSPSTPAVCWPYFNSCESFRVDSLILEIILYSYLALAVISVLSWSLRFYKTGIYLLWLLLALQLGIVAQDYRLAGDHYIAVILNLCFLLIPQRIYALPFSFFIFYFTAGLLKLNSSWLSGIAITNDSLFPALLSKWGSWYVLILELGLILLLFARKNILFYLLFIQLVFFHLYSWHITQFFAPATMLLLLGVLLILRPLAIPLGFIKTVQMTLNTSRAKVLLAGFLLLQIPSYFIAGSSAYTSEGQTYSLSTPRRPLQCQPYLAVWKKDQSKIDMSLQPPWLNSTTQCDPLIYWRLAQRACEWIKKDPSVIQMDLMIPARTAPSKDWQSLVAATDVCSKEIYYSSFFPNAWINKSFGIEIQ